MNDLPNALLYHLKPGEFITGVELGSRFEISRAAIQKHIANLISQGIPIHRVPGKGYRLQPGISLLNEQEIYRYLTSDSRNAITRIEIVNELASTNQWMTDLGQSGSIHGVLCAAEKQTQGKGRRGRSWQASPYRNITMSLGWQFPQWHPSLPTLGLISGLCVLKALRDSGVNGLKLKWPNDLTYEDKKVAGLLIDVSGEAHSECQVIIGVGINVSLDSPDAQEIDQPWIDLESIIPHEIDRNRLIASCLVHLVSALRAFPERGFAAYKKEWKECDALSGRNVTITFANDDSFTGCVEGVDQFGCLQVKAMNGQVEAFNQGDISVRMS